MKIDDKYFNIIVGDREMLTQQMKKLKEKISESSIGYY